MTLTNKKDQRSKLAIFAGTPVDTDLGSKLFSRYGYETLLYPLSKNPEDQTRLQFYNKKELEDLFRKKLEDAIDKNAHKFLIYCNSLSGAIDYEKIKREFNIDIVSPLDFYRDIKGYRSLAILAANGISAYKVEKIIGESRNIKTISFGNLRLVEAIESGKSKEEIIKSLGLRQFFFYLESIEEPHAIDGVVLACTHFPYLEEELKKITRIDIINPDDYIIERLKS